MFNPPHIVLRSIQYVTTALPLQYLGRSEGRRPAIVRFALGSKTGRVINDQVGPI